MPLFSRSEPAPAPQPESRGLFGRRHSPAGTTTITTNNTQRGGTGLFHRKEDASISAARQRIANAEAAEREADKALFQARAAVKDAREQVKVLEREAAEEAKLAKIKQGQAKAMHKKAKPLGRHDHV
ncbi:hypothetical protein MMC13_005485 [Lambiella insularis]|nr:hypothetical protein [Lambiella insularis]